MVSDLSIFYLPAVPCPPTNVTAMHTCAPHPVPVTWVLSDSATHYTAVAVSSRGHRSECMTNETSCSLPGLRCGEVYTIGVSGADDNCTGQLSDTVSLSTGNTTIPSSEREMKSFMMLHSRDVSRVPPFQSRALPSTCPASCSAAPAPLMSHGPPVQMQRATL